MTSSDNIEILIVDDEKASAKVIASFFDKEKFRITLATSAKQAISLLSDHYFPIILCDLNLGGTNGLALLPLIKQLDPPSAIIFVTGHGSLESAVNAVNEGAFDYISKTSDLTVMKAEIHQRVERALQQLKFSKPGPLEQCQPTQLQSRSIIGESPAMVKLYRMIAKAARANGNVLIMGESGTGKELVARAIHTNGPKADKPFVTVNCGALTETLLESELFGHVKGSFTGALSNKKGLFEEANEGALFLDEIGDVPLSLQVKLLRAIQEGEIKPVGSVENRTVQVRIIAATHRDLDQLMHKGTFREDLYYRLKVFQLEVPPLRERTQDIPALAEYFISRLSPMGGRKIENVFPEVLQLLCAYPWPGNIRELENAIEHAAGMANSQTLYLDDFPAAIVNHHKSDSKEDIAFHSFPSEGKSLVEIEKEHIARTLDSTHYNKSKAAEILKIDRGTLYRKVSEYGLSLKSTEKTQ